MIKIRLPWPPTLNNYRAVWRGRLVTSKKGREYSARVAMICRTENIPHISGPVSVKITLRPPDKRRRDFDNFNKAPWDALTKCGVLDDDSQVRKALIEFGAVTRPGEYLIEIEAYDEA